VIEISRKRINEFKEKKQTEETTNEAAQ